MKYIIFDFDGTIADSLDMMLELGNEMADKYGLNKVTHEELMVLNRLPIKERCEKMGIPLYKVPIYFGELVRKCRDKVSSLKLFDGVHELIYQLSQRYKLIIITSNSTELVKSFLVHHDLLHCFERIESSNSLFGKDVAIKKFIKNTKVDRSDVLYIGDEFRDIVASKKAGVKIISVAWGYDSYGLLNQGEPDYLVTKPYEIIEIMNNYSK